MDKIDAKIYVIFGGALIGGHPDDNKILEVDDESRREHDHVYGISPQRQDSELQSLPGALHYVPGLIFLPTQLTAIMYQLTPILAQLDVATHTGADRTKQLWWAAEIAWPLLVYIALLEVH